MKIKNKSFSDKSKKWLKRHLEDEYVIKSSKDNFRSRAAYKLIEIIEKYKLLDGLEPQPRERPLKVQRPFSSFAKSIGLQKGSVLL